MTTIGIDRSTGRIPKGHQDYTSIEAFSFRLRIYRASELPKVNCLLSALWGMRELRLWVAGDGSIPHKPKQHSATRPHFTFGSPGQPSRSSYHGCSAPEVSSLWAMTADHAR